MKRPTRTKEEACAIAYTFVYVLLHLLIEKKILTEKEINDLYADYALRTNAIYALNKGIIKEQ